MVQLSDLFDPGKLGAHLANRLVVERHHPTLPLTIYNYTDTCTFDRAWDEVTSQCRGLIVDADENVVARPFPKFFNWNEPGATIFLDLNDACFAFDKLDGSLGIHYSYDGHQGIATRGSFDSEQALHATEWWDQHCQGVNIPEDYTALFEIIYPGNRIVLNYGLRDELVLLAFMHNSTGRTIYDFNGDWWPHRSADLLEYEDLQQALAAPPREGAEGMVLHFLVPDKRIKIKQEDYVTLHRIIYGLNARAVWEHAKNTGDLKALMQPLPEELHPWVGSVWNDLHKRRAKWLARARAAYWDAIGAAVGSPAHIRKDPDRRKKFAQHITQTKFASYGFASLDGKRELADRISWEVVKPRGDVRPEGWELSEDTA